jgi:hypothetical protein
MVTNVGIKPGRFGAPLHHLPHLVGRALRERPTQKDRRKKPDNKTGQTKAARFKGGFLSEVIGWAPRG